MKLFWGQMKDLRRKVKFGYMHQIRREYDINERGMSGCEEVLFVVAVVVVVLGV